MHENLLFEYIMKRNSIQNVKCLRSFRSLNQSVVRNSSSDTRWRRTNIDDYTCEWSFPIRTLIGKGRRNDVIKELRLNQKAIRPLIVTDKSVYNLPITQVYIMRGPIKYFL